jgi:fatty-acid desaturase
MWAITPKSITLFILVSIVWMVGAIELWDTLTHLSSQWYWYVLAVIYTVTINELFAHLICTHKFLEVDTNSVTYKILTFLSTVDHAYSPITVFCLNHPVHHRYADVMTKDNLNFRNAWWTVCSCSPVMFIYQPPLTLTDKERALDTAIKANQDIFDDTWTFFCEEYKIPLTLFYWIVLYLCLPLVLFKVVFMGRFLMSIFNFLAAVFGHSSAFFGYRNFEVNNTSHNNLIFHYLLMLGVFSSLLHNNHHSYSLKKRHDYRWFEVDLGKYIIKLLSYNLSKKS